MFRISNDKNKYSFVQEFIFSSVSDNIIYMPDIFLKSVVVEDYRGELKSIKINNKVFQINSSNFISINRRLKKGKNEVVLEREKPFVGYPNNDSRSFNIIFCF